MIGSPTALLFRALDLHNPHLDINVPKFLRLTTGQFIPTQGSSQHADVVFSWY